MPYQYENVSFFELNRPYGPVLFCELTCKLYLNYFVKMCQSSVIVLVIFLALTSHSLSKFHETQSQNANENKRFSHDDILQRRFEIRSMIKTVFRGQSLFKIQYVDGIVPPGHQCPRNCHLRRGKCVRNLTPRIPC